MQTALTSSTTLNKHRMNEACMCEKSGTPPPLPRAPLPTHPPGSPVLSSPRRLVNRSASLVLTRRVRGSAVTGWAARACMSFRHLANSPGRRDGNAGSCRAGGWGRGGGGGSSGPVMRPPRAAWARESGIATTAFRRGKHARSTSTQSHAPEPPAAGTPGPGRRPTGPGTHLECLQDHCQAGELLARLQVCSQEHRRRGEIQSEV